MAQIIYGIHETRNHNWRCNFCQHTSWKTSNGAVGHVKREHPASLEREMLLAEIQRLKALPPKVVEKERIVYKDKPQPERWNATVYCSTCQVVLHNTGIPRGQTIERTPHSVCGTAALLPVREIQ